MHFVSHLRSGALRSAHPSWLAWRRGSTLASLQALARLAESRIRAAIEAGEFDGLPNQGQPLKHDDLSRVPADLRLGYRLMRNAGCLPPELEARKEAARLGALLAATGDANERARLSRLRADAELRYRVLADRRLR
jgi:Domain of unknown function (DUF1992)